MVIKWGASHEGMEPILWGKLTLKTPCKDFDLEIVGGLGWIKWLKMGHGNIYVSCNYPCTISFLMKILLVKKKKNLWPLFVDGVQLP